jgi:Tfp pilus assembly protein PilO
MSQTPAKRGLRDLILKQLSHPLKLKVALCAAMVTVWYFLFFSPLGERVSATTSRVVVERKRVATAREIERLKKALLPYRDLVGSGDVHELMQHVIQHLRSSPLRLIDLKPEKPKDLGPYDAIGLKLSIDGTFEDMDRFLGWIEAEKRLLRIDSIRLSPDTREAGRLSAQITLVTLADKPVASVKTSKVEAGKKP